MSLPNSGFDLEIFLFGASAHAPHAPGKTSVVGTAFIETRVDDVRRAHSGLKTEPSEPRPSGHAPAYQSVAVRMNEDGSLARVELLHHDPALNSLLQDWSAPELAVRHWQVWARRLWLPMVLMQADGTTTLIRSAPELTQKAQARRYGSPTRLRRPRFLVQRQTGAAGEMPIYRDAREIIAYE